MALRHLPRGGIAWRTRRDTPKRQPLMAAPCPFCQPEAIRVFFQTDLLIGLWDAFPVSPGHALLVLRRHVPAWFDATPAERSALVEGIEVARQAILAKHAPDGFNIGANVGTAAGQTVPHLHVHVIPRYAGDVSDPRGGVRHVIPAKANYLASEPRARGRSGLIAGEADSLNPHLLDGLGRAARFDVAVSFVMRSGVALLEEHLRDMLSRGGQLRMVVGEYMDITDPDALLNLLDLCSVGHADLRVFESNRRSADGRGQPVPFHPKGYIIHVGDGRGLAIVGSSNLSRSALTDGVEWNYRIVSSEDARGFNDTTSAFERLLAHQCVVPLTTDWVESYRRRRYR